MQRVPSRAESTQFSPPSQLPFLHCASVSHSEGSSVGILVIHMGENDASSSRNSSHPLTRGPKLHRLFTSFRVREVMWIFKMKRMDRWKNAVVGDYDWRFLCMPTPPWKKNRLMAPYFGKDEKIPLSVALVMGLQHALAMVGGIIVPPLLIANTGFTLEGKSYLVSASLIVSAFATFVQIAELKIPFTKHVIGSGMLSVMACTCNGEICTVGGSCASCTTPLEGNCLTAEQAYGKVLGTVLLVCWYQVAVSFCPPRILRRIFPPIVTGTYLILLGVSLIVSGFQQWGGGTLCAQQVLTSKVPCSDNGEVQLPFGHRNYLGLGSVVFITIIVTDIFGSPFMRNCQVLIGLLVGTAVAAISRYTDCSNGLCHNQRYVTGTLIKEAKWVTFLWSHTFPLGFYAPAILPSLFAFMVITMECIGNVTATTEASHLEPAGSEFEKRIQGSTIAQGLNSFFGALATSMPVTPYAQNNGVISLSRCASRRAGIACCFWLLIFGIFAKFAAVILTIPTCVFGAMTTFLFASVMIAGVHVISMQEGLTRRNRFIAIMSLGIGLGVDLVPAWVNITGQALYPNQGNFWPVNRNWSPGYRGFRDSIIIIASNGFSVGGFLALLLNLCLPYDKSPLSAEEDNCLVQEL